VVTGWVIDASMTLAWGLPDESSATADRFWKEVESGLPVFVPALWWFECANALVVARRRGRLDDRLAQRMSSLLAALPVETAAAPAGDGLLRLQVLAVKHDLSAYDAAYLDLVLTRTAGLATLDRRLADAARRDGITIWQP